MPSRRPATETNRTHTLFLTAQWPGWHDEAVNQPSASADSARLHGSGVRLERITLGWNIVGVIVLAISATRASSVALAGFGLDSLIEIGASTVVLWELSGTSEEGRQQRALRLIGAAFVALGIYLLAQSSIALLAGHRATRSTVGIVWTATTAAVMFTLAAGKARTGRALGNPVLTTEGKVTFFDGVLALAVLAGISLNAAVGWWWADPMAGLVIVYYAAREAYHIFADHTGRD
jgi:divalent metal cation (Fe/Co/Zn/Cd) transporter